MSLNSMDVIRRIVLVSLFVLPGAGIQSRQILSPRVAEGHPYIQQMVSAVSADSLMSNVRGVDFFRSADTNSLPNASQPPHGL